MRILIVEDEPLSAEQLGQMARQYIPDAEIAGICDSVETSAEWLKREPPPELIFMDIQLADGSSFEIFRRIKVNAPVIFITAFDQYTLQAFKVNSVDYLLKPLIRADFQDAVEKFLSLRESARMEKMALVESLIQQGIGGAPAYKNRFLFRKGDRLVPVESQDILWLVSEDKVSICHTRNGQSFFPDMTLDQMSGLLNPEVFFRANRKYLITRGALTDIRVHLNGKIKIRLEGCGDEEIYVSREKASEFRKWLGG